MRRPSGLMAVSTEQDSYKFSKKREEDVAWPFGECDSISLTKVASTASICRSLCSPRLQCMAKSDQHESRFHRVVSLFSTSFGGRQACHGWEPQH